MSPPAAAKRRHFDHKREQDQDEDDEEDNVVVMNKMTSGRHRLDLGSGGAELNNVSVNAKIGHFERLLQLAAPQHDSKMATGAGNKCLYRHQPIDDDSLYESREFGDGRAQCDAHDGLLNEAEMVDDLDDDDDYLGLDTIVEEDEVDDEEALARHAAAASTRTQATLRNNNCDNNIPSGTRLPAINIDTSHMNNDDDDDDTGGGGGNEKYCATRDTGNHIDTPSRPPAEMTTVIGDGSGSKVHLCRQPRAVETEEQQRQQKSPTTISENNDDELASGNNNYNNNNSFDTNNSVSMEGQLGPSGASPESIDNLTNSSLSTTTTSTTTNPTTSSTSQEQTSNDNKRIGGPANMSEPKIQQQQAYQPLLLPSTNRLISEHQARQQQTLFKALAERQKLLDELGPDERQQQADLMSSCLNPAFWRRRPSQQQHQNGHQKPSSRGTQRKIATKRRRESASASQKQQQQQQVQLSNYVTLKLRPNEASSKSGKSAATSSSASSSSSSSSKGVPLSAVDLSSVSDRMLDDLLGHIASASSSSSKAGSLDSSDLSSLSGSGNEDDNLRDDDDDSSTESELASSCRSPPSSFDEDDDDGDAGQRQRRSGPIRRHRRKHSHAEASGFVAQHSLQASDHQAPSVIGVHDEADAASLVGSPPASGRQLLKQSAVRSASASRKCREAYKKSRRGPDRSDEDDDYHDEDQNRRNQGDLAINSASAGSGSLTSYRTGGKPNGCSLSPASTRRQLNSSSTTVPSDNNSTDPRLAGPHPSESPTTSDEPSSMSLPMGPSDLDRDELRPTHRDQHQSVEAILGRMLEALQEVGLQQQQQQRQGEEQEQLNDLLERGFLHLEQLLNCSLAPRSSTGTLSQAQRAQSDSPGGSQLVGHQQAPASSHHLQAPSMPNPSISSSQQATSAMLIGGGSHIMLSKDSDYGSDTQSADCFSHSTSSGASNSSPAASGPQVGRSHALTSKQLSSSSSSPSSATLPSQQQHAATATHHHQFDHKDQDQQKHRGGLCETAPCDTAPTSEGALSPLAIELSFKLAESLRNLAQQQQRAAAAARAQREEQLSARAPAASAIGANNGHTDDDDDASDQDCLQSESMTTASRLQLKAEDLDADNKIDELHDDTPQATNSATTTPTTTTSVKPRMKSVVMINSPASCNSSLASRPHSSQSSASSQLSATVASGNMTPVDCGRSSSSLSRQPSSSVSSHSAAQRQQFKTFVNLNSSPESSAANNKTTTTTTSAAATAAVSCSGANSATQTIVKVVAASRGAGALERRPRSSFRSSSLRRKSSFSGSIGGGAPRPGSPVPRSALADTPLQLRGQETVDEPNQLQAHRVKTSTTSMEAARVSPNQAALECGADGQAGLSNQASATSVRQQRQLQRALILAQKYNYSPAKLAASKLGLELQLAGAAVKTPTKDSSRHGQEATEAPNGSSPTANAVGYSSPTLNHNNNKGGSNTSGPVPPVNNITGQVQLEISYFAKSGSLTVHLLQCAKLAPMAKRHTTSNPYVKLYLLPDKSKAGKRKSSIKRRQLDPKFNERFTFGPLLLADFDTRCLWLSVWHKDRGLGRNEFLGELLLPMSQIRTQLLTSDLCQSTPATWYQLQERQTQRYHQTQQQREQHQQAEEPIQVTPDGSNATGNSADTDQVRGEQVQSSHLLTTKRVPKSNGHLSLMLAKPGESSGQQQADRSSAPKRVQKQQAAELVARKLSEFEMKAARLTQQAQQRLSPSVGAQQVSGPAALQPPNSKSANKGATLAQGLTNGRQYQHQQQQQQHWQGAPAAAADFKTMQVTLGEASLQLNGEPAATASGCTGQLFVALKFVPESGDLLARRTANMEGSLHVLIKEARNITQSAGESGNHGQQQQQPQQLSSPYCKCYLLDAYGQRVAKQKTSALKRTSSPRWDHECVFANLRLTQLTAQAIEILLLNRDSILVSTGDRCLGAIRLCKRLRDNSAPVGDTGTDNSDHSLTNGAGLPAAYNSASSWSSLQQSLNASMKSNKSTGSDASAGSSGEDICSEREARLWTQMLARPNIWVYGELPLRQLRPLIAINKCQQVQQTTASNDISSRVGPSAAIGSHTNGLDQ